MTLSEVVQGVRSDDESTRTDAWQSSPLVGAPAVAPLAELTGDANQEIARAAMRGLWAITRAVGRPDAGAARTAVSAELMALTAPPHGEQLRREAIWMLSEVGDDGTVPVLSGLLSDPALRDDARMALERIPGAVSLAALREGLAAAPEDFKPNLAHSLGVRGEAVPGIPDMRMVPQRETSVTGE